MKYKRFEDLPVWNDSIAFAVDVLEFTSGSRAILRGLGDLKSQIERASISISNNIAEGFERGSNSELIHFLYIARGSCGECRSITHIFGRMRAFKIKKQQVLSLRHDAEKVSRQLYGWIESLKNAPFKGEKFLDAKERDRQRKIKEAREFREFLDKVTRGEQVDFGKLTITNED